MERLQNPSSPSSLAAARCNSCIQKLAFPFGNQRFSVGLKINSSNLLLTKLEKNPALTISVLIQVSFKGYWRCGVFFFFTYLAARIYSVFAMGVIIGTGINNLSLSTFNGSCHLLCKDMKGCPPHIPHTHREAKEKCSNSKSQAAPEWKEQRIIKKIPYHPSLLASHLTVIFLIIISSLFLKVMKISV